MSSGGQWEDIPKGWRWSDENDVAHIVLTQDTNTGKFEFLTDRHDWRDIPFVYTVEEAQAAALATWRME